MLEGKLPDAIFLQGLNIVPNGCRRIDIALRHDTSRPNSKRFGRTEKMIQERRLLPHEFSATVVIIMVPGVAEIRKPCVFKRTSQGLRQQCAVGEAGNLPEETAADFDEAQDFRRSKERLPSSCDYQPGGAPLARPAIIRLNIELKKVRFLLLKRTDGGPGETEGTMTITGSPDRKNATG